jgi:hypothetical protein
MDATDLEMDGTLFRSSLNNGEYSARLTILKIAFPCGEIRIMSGKKLEKLKSGKNHQKPKRTSQSESPVKEPFKPVEFGGIPDRNLKKNLGC